MERAYDDAKSGRPSADRILECTMPTVVDPTVAPAGKHVMSFFVQYAPYDLRGESWDHVKDRFADRCFEVLNEYAPNFKRAVIDRQVLSPLDRSEEHTSELQSPCNLVCRLLLEKKKIALLCGMTMCGVLLLNSVC